MAEFTRLGDGVEEVLNGDADAPFVVGRGVLEAEEGRLEQGLHKRETDSPDIILKGIDWTLGSDIQGKEEREHASALERHCHRSLPSSLFQREESFSRIQWKKSPREFFSNEGGTGKRNSISTPSGLC